MTKEPLRDRHHGTLVHVVAHRQHRPNLPQDGCPFCIGGLEASTPYTVKAIPNRWPALGEGRCEVVLYTPRHDASLASLDEPGVRAVIDMWAERTTHLLENPKVDFVLVFENRGSSVGATIDHPHCQIYAFDHVPARQRTIIEADWEPEQDPGKRRLARNGSWTSWVHDAPVFPLSVVIAPSTRRSTLASLDESERNDLARILRDVLKRCDALFGTPIPYMMWINQAPRSAPHAWMHIEIVSPWRAKDVPRYIAAAEVATGEYFNPVDPEELAARLNALST